MQIKTVGFPISSKEYENRRVLVPNDIKKIKHPNFLFFEKGYGEVLNISDDDYRQLGCNVVSRGEVLKKDIICDAKIGDEDYIENLSEGQVIFGWIHATQNKDITNKILKSKVNAYAWENMYNNGLHTFWKNNVLAGEAAIVHSFLCYGKLPRGLDVAVLGRGNTAIGATKMLNALGANTFQYSRRTEKLFRKDMGKYDVIVNCVLWDVSRTDHLVFESDLEMLKKNAMIVDVSCDSHGGIETSVPTTIEEPTYYRHGIMHYVVDHTPSLFYKTFTEENSRVIYPYIEQLMTGEVGEVLKNALVISSGRIVDTSISEYQLK